MSQTSRPFNCNEAAAFSTTDQPDRRDRLERALNVLAERLQTAQHAEAALMASCAPPPDDTGAPHTLGDQLPHDEASLLAVDALWSEVGRRAEAVVALTVFLNAPASREAALLATILLILLDAPGGPETALLQVRLQLIALLYQFGEDPSAVDASFPAVMLFHCMAQGGFITSTIPAAGGRDIQMALRNGSREAINEWKIGLEPEWRQDVDLTQDIEGLEMSLACCF